MRYVLITPARNESAFIHETLESMVAQSCKPERWVIVDDGSDDNTRVIVEDYCAKNSWVKLIKMPKRRQRNFAGKVQAFNAGFADVADCTFDLIGNLDADISFGPDLFQFLLQKFTDDKDLGVAGTAYTQDGWESTRDSFEGEVSVHGACQLFRRECFADIGGYTPNPAGGIDWIAVTTARMRGWKTRNFPERRFHHHRTMGTAERGPIGAMYDYGKKDYFLGGSPLWEFFRVAYRATKKPYILGGMALFAGYLLSAARRTDRAVSDELMRFHRREQHTRLSQMLRSLLTSGSIENYYIQRSEDISAKMGR